VRGEDLKRGLARLGRWMAHPVWRITTRGVLLATGLFELIDTPLERAIGLEIRLAHGVVFFAAAQVLELLGEMAADWLEWRARPRTPKE
jgi:hypothetical protein